MLDTLTLRRIIALQSDIVRRGLDLGGVMALVTRELMALAECDGIALAPEEGSQAEALLHLADQRMYDAKRRGRLAAAEGL